MIQLLICVDEYVKVIYVLLLSVNTGTSMRFWIRMSEETSFISTLEEDLHQNLCIWAIWFLSCLVYQVIKWHYNKAIVFFKVNILYILAIVFVDTRRKRSRSPRYTDYGWWKMHMEEHRYSRLGLAQGECLTLSCISNKISDFYLTC